MIEIAKKYHAAGLAVIPTKDKVPQVEQWESYMKEQSLEDIEKIFSEADTEIAILCNGTLEVIDLDVDKHVDGAELAKRYFDMLKDAYNFNLEKLTIQKTRSGGFHLVYRAHNGEGNQKLARNEKGEAIIETRGNRGYICAAPTPKYELVKGSFEDIKIITNTERNQLIETARCFNQERAKDYTKEQIKQMNRGGENSWAVYDLLPDALEVLYKYGWEFIKETKEHIHLNRPNARTGKTDGAWKKGENFFYCFTSSDRYFDGDKGYSPTAVLANLEYGGDFSETARQLYNKGFGNVRKDEKKLTDLEVMVRQVKSNAFDFHEKIVKEDTCLNCKVDNVDYQVGNFKNIGVIVGKSKSRKSSFIGGLVAAGLTGQRFINFTLNLQGKDIVFFDTEQSDFFFKHQMHRIFKMAGLQDNTPRFKSYPMRALEPEMRFQFVNHIINTSKNVGLFVIDGIVDICSDYMKSQESVDTITNLLRWTDESGALILNVIHLNESIHGGMRGHLGNEILRKADFVIELANSEDKTFSWVKAKATRFRSFNEFEMYQREDGTLYTSDEYDQEPVVQNEITIVNKSNYEQITPATRTQPSLEEFEF